MYIQNRRNSSKFNGCSPLKLSNGLISLKPAVAYFAYTNRLVSCKVTTRKKAIFGNGIINVKLNFA